MKFYIKEIELIKSNGPDKIILKTNLPDPMFPYDGNLSIVFDASQGIGELFINEHFVGIPYVVTKRGMKVFKFSEKENQLHRNKKISSQKPYT